MRFLFPLIGYLVGAIPFGYIIVRLKGKDIRKFGSGNIGATNVFRFDKKLGIITGILDILKSLIPTFFALKYFDFLIASITGILSIIGHATSPFLKFKGGKSVSCTFGTYIVLAPIHFLISFVFFILIIIFTKTVSIGSIISIFILSILIVLSKFPLYFKILTFFVFLFILFLHRENIKRIIKGEEKKLRF
ncbi:MAG: glycerol-3-phosphate 1-O-acyltransferase PlsY [candidate division WOR-3 bacterium]